MKSMRGRVALTAMFVVAGAFGSRAWAQPLEPVQDDFLDSLVGTWSGSGEMAGMPISHTFTWEWTLDHQFLRGDHEGTVTIDGQSQTVEVHFYLRPNSDGTYFGNSISSEGAINGITGHLSDEGAFVTDDTRADGRVNRLTIAVSGSELTMTIRVGDGSGEWQEVGSTTLTRL